MNEITLKPGESILIRAADATTPPVEPPPVDPPPVVIPPPVTGEDINFQGELAFTGARFDTNWVVGPQVAVFRIDIPNPFPDGYSGNVSQLSVFENGNGTFWRHATLSRAQGDMSPVPPAAAGNTGPNLFLGFGTNAGGSVPVSPGEVWYLNVKMEFWTVIGGGNKPSVAPGQNADFGVKLYPPSPAWS